MPSSEARRVFLRMKSDPSSCLYQYSRSHAERCYHNITAWGLMSLDSVLEKQYRLCVSGSTEHTIYQRRRHCNYPEEANVSDREEAKQRMYQALFEAFYTYKKGLRQVTNADAMN